MNALATQRPQLPAERAARRGAAISDGLAKSEAKHLAELEPPWSSEDFRNVVNLTDISEGYHPGIPVSPRTWSKAREALQIGPSLAVLDRYIEAIEPAAEGPTDKAASRAMIGMMLASFPNGRPPDLDAYLETLMHDAMALGFSPHAICQACQSIRRSLKFLPSVAEFVEACEAARRHMQSSAKVARFLRERLACAREIAALPEPDPAPRPVLRPAHEGAEGAIPF